MAKLMKLFADCPNERILLSGNEAFARGIFEAGVKFAANYPGTPVSEVGDYLNYLSETNEEFTFDYSLNEAVALESCIGASWAGVRSVVMFKHLGLNVAADPLHTFPYSGTIGGMVILCGGDPGILSSTNAQDNRLYSLHTKIPMLEPATVQECKDFIKEGLRISELYQIPIHIHTNTRLCHSHGIVTFGEVENRKKVGHFKKDPDRHVNTLRRALVNQKKYFEKIKQVAKNTKLFNLLNIDKLLKPYDKNETVLTDIKTGIITSGVSYGYVIQACRKLKINPPILKLGLIFPINREEICNFANRHDINKLLVVEELEPFMESFLKSVFCNFCDHFKDLEIHGKDFLPNIGELNTDIVVKFFSKHFEVKSDYLLEELSIKELALAEILPDLPNRQPTFCVGCQYRPVFYALKQVTSEISEETGIEFLFCGDIGCYTLVEAYPFQLLDFVVCMGAGIGIANGLFHGITEKQKLVAYIGDSTLFHSGLQPLLNAIKNDVDVTIIILYNYWTAMTSHQPHISTPNNIVKHEGNKSTTNVKQINLINFIQSLGIENLEITGAYNVEKLERIFTNNFKKKGTKVIVIEEECALEKKRRLRRESKALVSNKKSETYYKISESCVKCNECIEFLGCPAINAQFEKQKIDSKVNNDQKEMNLQYYIDEARCVPEICPGVCQSVCKNYAIHKTMINPPMTKKEKG